MKTIFILYMPGYAGNLINRLISLSQETVPQYSLSEMQSAVNDKVIIGLRSRLNAYSFLNAKRYQNWQEFHRDCADFYNRNLVKEFSTLFKNKFTHVVYAIHPEEFELFEPEIDTMWDLEFFYVNLNKKHQNWVSTSKNLLGFVHRNQEYANYQKFINQYRMRPIHLSKMLDSQQGFEEEYLRVITDLGLTPELEQARILYAEWLELRGPNKI